MEDEKPYSQRSRYTALDRIHVSPKTKEDLKIEEYKKEIGKYPNIFATLLLKCAMDGEDIEESYQKYRDLETFM